MAMAMAMDMAMDMASYGYEIPAVFRYGIPAVFMNYDIVR